MNVFKIIFVSLILTLLLACSEKEPTTVIINKEPTINAETQESVLLSLDEMIAVDPEREQELRRAIDVIGHHSMMSVDYTDVGIRGVDDGITAGMEIFLNSVKGKTADELVAEMKRIENINRSKGSEESKGSE